jgi:hypothetical protein
MLLTILILHVDASSYPLKNPDIGKDPSNLIIHHQ